MFLRDQPMPASPSPTEADRLGVTWLHLAAWRGDLTLVRSLLTSGASLDARDLLGWTPLMAAAQAGPEALPVVKALLEAGADRQRCPDQHQDQVAGRPVYEAGDHGASPARAACRSSRGGARL